MKSFEKSLDRAKRGHDEVGKEDMEQPLACNSWGLRLARARFPQEILYKVGAKVTRSMAVNLGSIRKREAQPVQG